MTRFLLLSLTLFPSLASAQVVVTGCIAPTFKCFVARFNYIFDLAIPLAVGLAIAAFFYGVARYIYAAREGAELEKAKNILFWGTIALAVLFSLAGIILLLQTTFSINPSAKLPQFPPSYFESR